MLARLDGDEAVLATSGLESRVWGLGASVQRREGGSKKRIMIKHNNKDQQKIKIPVSVVQLNSSGLPSTDQKNRNIRAASRRRQESKKETHKAITKERTKQRRKERKKYRKRE